MSALAEPVPERLTADTVNARWAAGAERAAALEPRLVRQYEVSLRATARRCVAAYRARTQVLTAAMPPKPEGDPTNISQPPQPTVDQVLNAELAAASAEARTQTTRRRMAAAVAGEILGSFEPDEGTRALLEPLVRRQAGVQAARLVEGSRDAVANIILDALVEGWSVDTTADYMLKVLNEQARWRAVMLARTDLIALGNGAADASVRALGDAGPQYKTWLCLAPDTRVRGRVLRVARREHRGSAVTLSVAPRGLRGTSPENRDLTVTPNHPVLTNRGWVEAQFLQPGDGVFSCPSLDAEMVVKPHVEDIPPTVMEVFDTAADTGPTERAVSRVVNLDGEWEECEVDVVAVNGELRDRVAAKLDEEVAQFVFALSDVGLHTALAESGVVRVLRRQRGARSGLVALAVGGEGGVAVCDPPRLASGGVVSDGYAAQAEDPGDGVLRSAELSTELAQGGSGFVAPLEVVSVDVVPWSGHVYDLETENGWFIANSIIVHNSAGDDRVRPTHVEADRQTVQADQPFNVGTSLLQFPGDPSGADEDVINCRCTQIFSDSPQPVLRHTFDGGIREPVLAAAVLASALSADELEALTNLGSS